MKNNIGLSNTLKLLKNEKKLNVAFMGGSVTDGHKSTNPREKGWPKLVCNWLSEKYGADVTENRQSMGGTTSYFAAFRYSVDVVTVPDLFFIEFAINDKYAGYSYDFVFKSSESLVRKALSVNPKMDIVYVLTFDRGVKADDYDTLRAHRDVAEKYGFPCIKLADKFYESLKDTDKTDIDYIPDGVHPNDDGYYRYFEIIRDYLDETFSITEAEDSILTEKVLPRPLSDYFKNLNFVKMNEIELKSNTGWTFDSEGNLSWIGNRYGGIVESNEPSSKFTFNFKGTDLGIVCEGNVDIGQISVIIDGKEPIIVNANLSYSNPRVLVLASDLNFGEHEVKIELLEKKFKIAAFLVN